MRLKFLPDIIEIPDGLLIANRIRVFKIAGTAFAMIEIQIRKTPPPHLQFERESIFYDCKFLYSMQNSYLERLLQLQKSLGIIAPNYWQRLCVYQIKNLQKQPHWIQYQARDPAYGQKVQISIFAQALISNTFQVDRERYYFLDQRQPLSINLAMQLVLSQQERSQKQLVLGICIVFNTVMVCIPFSRILSNYLSLNPLVISPRVMHALVHTCYLECYSSYCSGIMIANDTIMTVKHLIPLSARSQDMQVYVRCYPYTHKVKGKVVSFGIQTLDYIIIKLKQPYKLITDKILGGTTPKKILNTLDRFFNFKKQSQHSLGQDLISVGFGKFSYSPGIFQDYSLVLPSATEGIISKVIHINEEKVFIKSDARLFNGFSGSGLWGAQSDTLLGMAIFILKNGNTMENYNSQNFSYCMDFLKKIVKYEMASTNGRNALKQKQQVIKVKQGLSKFEKMNHRKQITIILNPKL